MFAIVKFIAALGEWLPLPLIFSTEAMANAHIETLGAGCYRVEPWRAGK